MASLNDIWSKCVSFMAEEINNPRAVRVWVNQIRPLELTGEYITLCVPNHFYWEIINSKYGDLIRRAVQNAMGFPVSVNLIIEEDFLGEGEERIADKNISIMPLKPPKEDHTFDNYVVGNSNRLAYAACRAVADNPASAYNPLFLYGGTGLGKTHLMHSIINVVMQNHPNFNILYVSCEDFTNELVLSLKSANMESFRNKYREIDLLLIDDIQFIGGKEQTQEEFFHTFEHILNNGKQIVLASDRPPKEINQLTERLRSRFESGLLADIQSPDYELRLAIIKKKSEGLNMNLPDDVVDFLATRLKYSVRQLEGALKKILALTFINKVSPTIATAQSAVADILNENEPVEEVISRIIIEVGRYYSIEPDTLKSERRTAPIAKARQVCMYIIRTLTDVSLSQIGSYFGGRDHATVNHSINAVEKKIEENPSFKNTITDIINAVKHK